ncbi:MAG: DUF3568 family protein [Planctomycetes bacterium]|nr:DUF3568 family protein [Planctomycetota bacterium]
MKHLLMMAAAVIAGTSAACRSTDLGTGMNTVEREYLMSSDKVWDASLQCVQDAGLSIESKSWDALGGEIRARRANLREIQIHVKNVDDRHTLVSVRAGEGDLDMANLLHERIAENLGLGQVRRGWFGGNSLEHSYAVDLGTCWAAAKRVAQVLELTALHEERHERWIQLDARGEASVPVRIKAEREQENRCKVTFIAGVSKSEDNEMLVRRMKSEFDRAIEVIQ